MGGEGAGINGSSAAAVSGCGAAGLKWATAARGPQQQPGRLPVLHDCSTRFCAAHSSVDVPASQQMLLLGQSGGPCRCCPLLPSMLHARHPSIHVSSNLQPELASAPAGFPTGSRVGRGSVALVGHLAEMTEGSSSAPEALGKVRAPAAASSACPARQPPLCRFMPLPG